jgi:hypothetical protein
MDGWMDGWWLRASFSRSKMWSIALVLYVARNVTGNALVGTMPQDLASLVLLTTL